MAECSTLHKVKDKVLLLVGRTGSGKSSTANSIIGETFFGRKKDDFSIQKNTVEIEGSKVTVVDGTGIGDTGSDMNGDIQGIIQKTETAVQLCESGFNALIFVMTYVKKRFAKKEKDAVDLIKSLFGRDIFRRFGVIVMTRGDQFEMDTEDDPKTFYQWCKEKTGHINFFFQECEYRILIFNNRSSNKDTLFRQRRNLLDLINETRKYSTADFKPASSDQMELLISDNFIDAEKQNQMFIRRIDQTLDRTESTKDGEKINEMLSDLLTELEERIKNIEGYFGGSELSHLLLIPLKTRVVNVTSKMRKLNQIRHETPIDKAAKKQSAETGYDKKTKRGKFFEKKGENPVDEKIQDTTNTYDYFSTLNPQEKIHSVVKHTVLLLVGRTGNGKSSTANSLIDERFFATGSNDHSVKKMTVEIDGLNVTVVDGTGIGDTGSDMNGGLQDTIQKAETAVQLCESGFNALIFVMAYGTRFTKKEKDSVDLIKSLFGRDIFRRFGIIVMTRGDQFETDTEDDHKTFDQWCMEQTGDIRSLFQECDYRIVIFNNIMPNLDTLFKQQQNLLKMVPHSNKYSLEDFNQASKERQKILLGHSFLEADKQNKSFLQDIDQQIFHATSTKESKQRRKMLANILSDLQQQIESIQKTFEGSEYYSSLWTPLQTRLLNVMTQLRDIEDGLVKNYAFLLVGRSGNGKSSTGNSIFGKIVFITRKPHDSSDGDVLCSHSAIVEGRPMFVVDGTGIGDTGDDINGGVNELLESVDFTMKNEMSKFNAIILVHYIHERSLVKITSSVLAIKSILGPNVFKNWGIIVVTFGDQFDLNNLDENIHSFEDWCQQQTGYFQILLEECNNRCVLFDNKTTDKNKQMEQRNKLMSVVDSMTYKSYTMYDFDSPTCKLFRQHLRLIEEINLKSDSFNGNTTNQYEGNKHDLELLVSKLLEHKQRLAKQGKETEFTRQLLYQVTETATKLQLKIGYCFMAGDNTITKFVKDLSLLAEEPPSSQSHFHLSPPKDELKTSKLSTSAIQDVKKFNTIDSCERTEVTEAVDISTSNDIDGRKESTDKRTQKPTTIDKQSRAKIECTNGI